MGINLTKPFSYYHSWQKRHNIFLLKQFLVRSFFVYIDIISWIVERLLKKLCICIYRAERIFDFKVKWVIENLRNIRSLLNK